MSETDLELLARLTRHQAEDAFAELVRRHLDLVHSAALRQLRSPQLAEEVAQSVFIKLARHAHQLAPDTIVSAWLYQVSYRAAIDVVRREAGRQLREQIATEMNAMNATADDWSRIAPLLDEAMHALDESDRAAVLLRYFENKSLREVGQSLGTSDDTAQKRVSRAVDRLREFFAKRGVSVGAGGLSVAISANAVQTAPIGLALSISTAATLAGAGFGVTTAVTATKAIAMTTLQKGLLVLALAASVGTGIYEAYQAANLRAELRKLQQRGLDQIQQAQQERDEASVRLLALAAENERLKFGTADLLKLRAEVARLRAAELESARLRAAVRSPEAPSPASPLDENKQDLKRENWADVGFATPQDALRTRGWAVLNGKLERFKDSVFVTDETRMALETAMTRMLGDPNDPAKAKAFKEIQENKFAVEEGLLMRMIGENRGKEYTGYRILSQQSPSADEAILEIETQMKSAPARQQTLTFRRFGSDWKVVVDKDLKTAGR